MLSAIDEYWTFIDRLPPLEQLEDSIQLKDKFIPDQQKVAKELNPLIKFIDFGRIKGQILVGIIERLEIIPTEIILNIYRDKIMCNPDLNGTRGISAYIWEGSVCGSELIIEDNGKVVQASRDCDDFQGVRAKIALNIKGIFEWDFIIEKSSDNVNVSEVDLSVGICASENFDYNDIDDFQWELCSDGTCNNFEKETLNYCPPFGIGAKITVRLDMNKRTCAFTVNGTKYPEVSEWNNLPSKLYPVAVLKYPGRIRIQPHQKIDK